MPGEIMEEPIDPKNYTSNKTIDSIEVPDSAVNICGYVAKVDSNQANNDGKKIYYKLIITNGSKRVQITAWTDLIPRISHIDKLKQVVFISNLKASYANPNYNRGNVSFELVVQENSFAEILGVHAPAPEDEQIITQLKSFLTAKNYINDKVVLYGWVKTTFDIFTGRNLSKCLVSSITDGTYKIEVKCDTIYEELKNNIPKGYPVKVIGILEKSLSQSPIVLSIDSLEDYQALPVEKKEDILTLKELIDAYFSVEKK